MYIRSYAAEADGCGGLTNLMRAGIEYRNYDRDDGLSTFPMPSISASIENAQLRCNSTNPSTDKDRHRC